MEFSLLEESTVNADASIQHGTRRKLDADFSELDHNESKEKKPRCEEAEVPTKEHMNVYLRVRPFTEKEEQQNENQGCMGIENQHILVARAPAGSNTYKNSQHGSAKATHRFTFSKIFDEKTSQKEFFDHTILDKVKDFIDGQNSLIFTYGVTNSGKTYTIQGHAKDGGILPRCLDVLFNSIGNRQSAKPAFKPSMFCDVVKLSEADQEADEVVKQQTLEMAIPDEESDVTVSSMVADSDSSRLTIGSRISEDSLNSINVDSGHGSEQAEGSDKSAIDQIFKEAEERVREEAAVNVDTGFQAQFSVWVTFIEIYNEYIYDLLEPIPKKKTTRRATLTLREDKNGIPYVKGVKHIPVTTADEAYKILVIGKQNLQMACTKLNHNSSRSHCIFSIKLIHLANPENPYATRINMLSFCDLAGAERYSKTLSGGERIKEAGNINTSLLSLGRCIKILRHNQHNKEHPQMVPFRDSKLTRIFQSSLTGKGKASMIVNINQCASTFDETLHALKYSAIAKQVVIVQEPPKELEQEKPDPPQRSSRYVSLLLAQAQVDPKGPRPTINFGTPGSLAKILQEEEDDCPTPKAESEDDQETILVEIIDTLKAELVKERNEKDMLEWNIRNEVFNEVQEHMQQQEQRYEQIIKDLRDRMEDRADTKVNLLLQSMKKKKRPKSDEDEVDQIDLMKAALEAKDTQIEIYEGRIKQLEDDLKNLGEQPQKTPPKKKEESRPSDQDHMAVINQLHDKLTDTKAQLAAKEAEVADLGEMLSEAGETFEQKAAEIEALEKRLESFDRKGREQEARIDELTRMLEKANKGKEASLAQCHDLDKKVAMLKSQLEAANAKDCEACQEQVVQLGELVSKLADTEAEVDKINHDFVRLQTEGAEKDDKLEKLNSQIAVMEKELSLLRESHLKSENSPDTQLEGKVTKLQGLVNDHQGALHNHEAFVVELNKQHQDLQQELEHIKTENNECNSKLNEANEKLKKEEDELFKTQEQLALLEEQRDQLVESLEAKEKKALEEGRRSLALENKISALEQSLQQANSTLRDTALEAAQSKEKIQELTQAQEELETTHNECKPQISELTRQLEDYILRVNEQVERIDSLKEKLSAETKKAAELQDQVSETKGRLFDQDGEVKNLQNRVTDLEARLKAERQQQKSAGNELDELLQSKAITIEELNTTVSHLKNKVLQQENEVRVSKEQNDENLKKVEQLDEELKSQQSLLSTAKVTESKMKDDMESGKQELSQAQARLLKSELELEMLKSEMTEKLEIAENKINSLQMSLEMSEESSEEIIEVKAAVEKLTSELTAAEAKIKQLETQDSGSDKQDGSGSNEEVDKLQNEIRQLKNEVTEAQYSAQMNGRILRREKSQVERKLKETEEELNEIRNNMLKLQTTIAVDKLSNKLPEEDTEKEKQREEDIEDLKKQLEEQTKKSEKLEDVIKDLEDCLRCAKGGQQAAEDNLESYKQKCRSLEKELSIREDRMQSMESRLSDMDIKTKDIEMKKEEINRLNSSVCELEHKCKEYRSGMDALEARLSYIGMLEEKNESILSELDEHDRKAQELNLMLEEAEKRISKLEAELSTEKEKLAQEQGARTATEEDLKQSKAVRADLAEKVSQFSSETEKLVSELKVKNEELENMKKERDMIKDKLNSTINAKTDTDNGFQTQIQELEIRVEEQKSTLVSLEKSKVELESTMKKSLEEKQATVEDLRSQMDTLQRSDKQKTTELQTKLEEIDNLQQSLQEKETELQKLRAEIETLESEKSSVSVLLTSQEANVESFKKQVSSLKDEVHALIKKVDKLTTDKEEGIVTIQSLRLEVDVKNTKIAELEESVKKVKENETNPEELEKARKREKELRTQLSEASSRQEDQNKKFNALEDQLRDARDSAEKQEEAHKDSRNTISRIRDELRTVRQELTSAQEDGENAQRRHEADKTALEAKVKNLEEDIEKKEAKLKSRSSTITELMGKLEHERNGYEISLQDARANEAVLGQLKQALEDQDATIELQEKALAQKEEDISVAQKAHDELIEKYNTLLKDTSSHSSNVRDMTRTMQKLREDRKEAEQQAKAAEEQLAEAKAAVGRSDKEKAQFKRDIEDTNHELQEMEKILSDARREIDQLKTRLAEMKTDKPSDTDKPNKQDEQKLALLKTKFVALEGTNQQLEQKVIDLQKEIKEIEESKKEELEERDKFVSQLEKILKQKEAENQELKKALANKPKTDYELQNRLDKLETDISDKDAIINELSRHLDNQKTRTSGRRATRHGSPPDDSVALRKELDDLRKQLEAERQTHCLEMSRVVKAKDEVINDFRHTNLTLQSRLPGASQPILEVKEESDPQPDLSPRKAPARKSTRGRGKCRKRKSDEEEAMDAKKNTKRKPNKRQEAQLQVSFDENSSHGVTGAQGEELEEVEGLLTETPAKRLALTDTLNTTAALRNSMFPSSQCPLARSTSRKRSVIMNKSFLAKFVSPAPRSMKRPDEPQSERSRRRVKLRATVDEPFTESPPGTPTEILTKDKSHEIVTRKLRTRRTKCTNV